MKIKAIIYIAVIAFFSSLMWWVVQRGQILPMRSALNYEQTFVDMGIGDRAKPVVIQKGQSVAQQFLSNIKNPLSLLLLQMIVILSVARIFGIGAGRMRQPVVVGEILAGIFLGPSVLGWVFPDLLQFLFSKDSLKNLQFLSQFGLIDRKSVV